ERLKQEWNSPIYAFFSPSPAIEYVGGCCLHVFRCAAKGCGKTVCRFLDKSNAQLTGNLCKHVGKCWGEDVLHQVFEFGNVKATREAVKSFTENGSITVAFERKNKEQVQFSHRPHKKWQTRAEICLMKTGRPGYYLPNPRTVSRDIQKAFVCMHQKLTDKLQHTIYGNSPFITPTWTAPNHRSFAAVTVHLEEDGKPLVIPLDVVEVARV
ncbi:hypothetical protein SCLCIDRAFT_53292, partial [Scleroderma citrinum Foug A]